MHGDAAEVEEDLSKVEWGAGLARLITAKFPNLIFFCLGWSTLALPTYLLTGLHETALSHGGDIVFPIVLSAVFLITSGVLFVRVTGARSRARHSMSTPLNGGVQASDPSWYVALGFGLESTGAMRLLETTALWCATVGVVGLGWASGLTTFCAYNKADEPPPPVQQSAVYWQECFEFSRAWQDESVYGTPSHLPMSYFALLIAALACAVGGPAMWFILWKVVRQAARPTRVQMRSGDGLRELPQTAMFALAVSVGVIAGAGAWVFRQMIGLVHNVFFMQKSLMSSPFFYDANEHTPPPALPLPLIILSPIIGGLIVAFLVQNWAPEAKGHGVPEVMDAIHYKRGRIRPSVAGVKILAPSFSIGSGGSVGREGPIIQIGSTFGSIVGVASKCAVSQRVTLIACGAAGGIAATFNTPIGGMVFAIELMLPAANSRTLMPLGISSAVATYIGRAALGLHPAFNIPALQNQLTTVESVLGLLTFLPFGVVIGLVAVLFVKGIYWAEDCFDYMPGNYYSRHALGMLGQGLLMYSMISFSGEPGELGHYYIQGVGYATVRDVLSWVEPTMAGNGTQHNGTLINGTSFDFGGHGGFESGLGISGMSSISSPTFCLLLFLAKALSTGMTIGSGASGGIFSPSLYLGATIGAAWGHVVYAALDFMKPLGITNATPFDPVQACVAGMAGMVGGSTGASITAITMTFEMTRDYKTILPIVITTVMAHMTRKAISEDSIYTLKLVRRGHVVPEGLQAAFQSAQRVKDVMTSHFRVLSVAAPMTKYAGVTLVQGSGVAAASASGTAPLVANDSAASAAGGDLEAVCGPVLIDTDATFGRTLRAIDYAAASGERSALPCVVSPLDDLSDAMRRMSSIDASTLLVSRAAPRPDGLVATADIVGVVTKTDIAANVAAKSTLMARDRTLGSAKERMDFTVAD